MATRTRKTTKKATSKKATTTTKKAKRILDAQKREWKRIWKEEVSGRRNPQEAAERAGQRYRLEYGATPKARWKNALAKAKKA